MKKSEQPNISGQIANIANPDIDLAKRVAYLRAMVTRETGETLAKFLVDLCELRALEESSEEDEANFRAKRLELESGPGRPGTFLGVIENGTKSAFPEALVLFGDGMELTSRVPNPDLLKQLSIGDTVIVDSQARIIRSKDGNRPFVGEVCVLEKKLAAGQIQVRFHDDTQRTLHVHSALREKIEKGEVTPGASLFANAQVAYGHIPSDKELSHFRFLDQSPLPDLTLEADVGDPNPIIADVYQHVSQEMTSPEMRRKYGLPRSFFATLLGPAGTGKSHSIQAVETQIYELMGKILGIPVKDLPRRSLTLNIPSVISKWLGSSDRNLAAFARQCSDLASRSFKAPDGKDHLLPVIVKCEELDGLARKRSDGEFDGGASDRILTTFLQLFDPARPEFKDSIIIFLCTSNQGSKIDPAALRRMGMKTYHFTRLTRRKSFEAVLAKQLTKTPMAGGGDQAAARRAAVSEVSAWLFAAREQDPIVDLAYVGSAEAVTKLRRDFLTPALLNRGVISSAAEGCAREVEGIGDGVTVAELKANIDIQIRTIVEQMTPENVRDFLDIPDGIRVATVKRKPKPVIQRFEAVQTGLTGRGAPA
ncbi:MAG: AAA family ATPase [Lentisphaerae bacterium]|nr:AAA family ATPase [Lentisphaerota bacterium]